MGGLDVLVVSWRMIEHQGQVKRAQRLRAGGERIEQTMKCASEGKEKAAMVGVGGVELKLSSNGIFERAGSKRCPPVGGFAVQEGGFFSKATRKLALRQAEKLPQGVDAQDGQLISKLGREMEIRQRHACAPLRLGAGRGKDPALPTGGSPCGETMAGARERVATVAMKTDDDVRSVVQCLQCATKGVCPLFEAAVQGDEAPWIEPKHAGIVGRRFDVRRELGQLPMELVDALLPLRSADGGRTKIGGQALGRGEGHARKHSATARMHVGP